MEIRISRRPPPNSNKLSVMTNPQHCTPIVTNSLGREPIALNRVIRRFCNRSYRVQRIILTLIPNVVIISLRVGFDFRGFIRCNSSRASREEWKVSEPIQKEQRVIKRHAHTLSALHVTLFNALSTFLYGSSFISRVSSRLLSSRSCRDEIIFPIFLRSGGERRNWSRF